MKHLTEQNIKSILPTPGILFPIPLHKILHPYLTVINMAPVSVSKICKIRNVIKTTISNCLSAAKDKHDVCRVFIQLDGTIALLAGYMDRYILYTDQLQLWYSISPSRHAINLFRNCTRHSHLEIPTWTGLNA